MTPEERAKLLLFGKADYGAITKSTASGENHFRVTYPELIAAIREAVKAEREACELIAMRYRDKMARSASERRHDGLPTDVAVSKFDAADAIAAAIRERPL